MKTRSDHAIVIARTNYGEKDRIVTLLCQESGKITVLAKSVRGPKSRLVGGVELFSVAEINYVEGRGGLSTLTGARLIKHFGGITNGLDRSNLAFQTLKIIHKAVDQDHGQEYFSMLVTLLRSLDDDTFDLDLVEVWFGVQLLHTLGVFGRVKPEKIPDGTTSFAFDYADQRFVARESGEFEKNDLKLLDLCLKSNVPPKLTELRDMKKLLFLIRSLLKSSVFEV